MFVSRRPVFTAEAGTMSRVCIVEAAGTKSGRMMGEEEGRGFVVRARRDDEGVSASTMTTAR